MSPKYVGFWARVLASLVDTVLIVMVLVPVALMLFWDQLVASEGILEGPANIIFNYVLPLVIVIAFWVYRSATPGKMMMKAVIVDADTLQKPEMWQWVVRYLGYYISTLLLGLGFLCLAHLKERQPHAAVDVRIVRRKVPGLLELLKGLLVTGLQHVGVPEVEQGIDIRGIDLEGCVELGNGAVGSSLFEIHDRQFNANVRPRGL